jgi:hypothetical protein
MKHYIFVHPSTFGEIMEGKGGWVGVKGRRGGRGIDGQGKEEMNDD